MEDAALQTDARSRDFIAGVESEKKDSNLGEGGEKSLSSKPSINEVSESSSSKGSSSSRAGRMRERLQGALHPVELDIEDVSHKHAGHTGIRGNEGGETHFNVKVVSDEFQGMSLVKRHRLIYGLLQEELQSGLHALSIIAKTSSETVYK